MNQAPEVRGLWLGARGQGPLGFQEESRRATASSKQGPFILEGSSGPWSPHYHHVVTAEASEI